MIVSKRFLFIQFANSFTACFIIAKFCNLISKHHFNNLIDSNRIGRSRKFYRIFFLRRRECIMALLRTFILTFFFATTIIDAQSDPNAGLRSYYKGKLCNYLLFFTITYSLNNQILHLVLYCLFIFSKINYFATIAR